MKRFFSIFLVLVITLSICFQCSISSYAIAGVDDIVVLGVCLDLLALGISIYNVREFCQSQQFADFCRSIGNSVDSGISAIRRNGKLFVATTKLAWQDICNWVKSKFSGIRETINIEYDVTRPSYPSNITLKDGTVVPWGDFMQYPFLIYKLPNGNYTAWYCSGENPGVNIMQQTIRILCTGNGKCYRFRLINGSWDVPTEFNMTYGWSYKGTTGSFFDVNNSTINNFNNYIQYRTLDKVYDNGVQAEETPPNETPEEDLPSTAFVTASLDPAYYPGAVDAPAEVIDDNDLIMIPVPDALITESVPGTPELTTSIPDIADTIASTVPADVLPVVYNNYYTITNTPADIIADTPAIEIPGGSVESDIDTANKFRLPKSFLEGFPFSIPYSIYVGIQSFVAEPQAPVLNLPFRLPALGLNEDITVDLNQWNSVARLCRALLSVVWIAGLAMVCSRFIKR